MEESIALKKVEFPKAQRDKWIKALRSDKYKQTTMKLKTRESNIVQEAYCCLGILCKLTLKQDIEYSNFGHFTTLLDSVGSEKFVNSKKIVRALKTDLCGDDFLDQNLELVLVHLNDVKEYSFKQIADFIEQQTIGI